MPQLLPRRPSLRPLVQPLLRPLLHPLLHPVDSAAAVRRWPVHSQTVARRNALVANTELAHRRAEREEVDRFLHELTVPHPRTAEAPVAARRAR